MAYYFYEYKDLLGRNCQAKFAGPIPDKNADGGYSPKPTFHCEITKIEFETTPLIYLKQRYNPCSGNTK